MSIPANADVSVFSKNEKKSRALFKKLNLKKVEDISRITFRRKNNIFGIDKPEVYKSPAGTYLIFGEAKLEDTAERFRQASEAQSKLRENSPEVLKNAAESIQAAADKSPESITADLQAAAEAPKAAEEDDDEEVDATGVEEDDIKVVMSQTNVLRNKAIKALKENSGDIVNAIMYLTS